MASIDVVATYTSIPIDSALQCTETLLRNQNNTEIEVQEIIKLLEFCLSNNVFQFEDIYYIQKNGLVMGNPLSPILADIVMNHFETHIKAFRS